MPFSKIAFEESRYVKSMKIVENVLLSYFRVLLGFRTSTKTVIE